MGVVLRIANGRMLRLSYYFYVLYLIGLMGGDPILVPLCFIF